MSKAVSELRARGQCLWLDYIQRSLITSGHLAEMVAKGWVSGVTSNPSIFRKAVTASNDYDRDLQSIGESGMGDPYLAFVSAGGEDIKLAAEVLTGVFETTGGRDGYVSLEAPPNLAFDYEATVDEARRLFDLIGWPNAMIKVPGTDEGIEAIEDLIADGVNVNQTLLFSIAQYERSAQAYIRGLERRLDLGLPIDKVASVASFFVSRLDTAVDAELPENSELRGKAAIANTSLAYLRFGEIFSGRRWERLAAEGAMVQRPLWASTSTKNPAYSDTLYVDALIANDTVNTLPEVTLAAFADHGDTSGGIEESLETADTVMKCLAEEGIDIDAVTARLLEEGVKAFADDFAALLERIGELLIAAPGSRTELGLGD